MNKSFLWSLFGHIFIILLMVLDFSFGLKKQEITPPAVMIVDLTKLKISNKTNLPQKTIKKKKVESKVSAQKQVQKTNQKSISKSVAKTEKKPVVKPKETPVKDATPVKIPEPKKEEVKIEKTNQKSKENNDLQNLLSSVEKVRKAPTVREVQQENIQENEGIQGGMEGRVDQLLSISEKDFLASELQKCWNVNAGVERADEITVEIKAWLNKDGSVREVKIINSMPIPSFNIVAESAKRSIYICGNKGLDSPFRILAEKYADHYGDWKEISLRFSPLLGIQ